VRLLVDGRLRGDISAKRLTSWGNLGPSLNPVKRRVQSGRQWQYNGCRLLLGIPVGLPFGMLAGIAVVAFLWSKDLRYLVMLGIVLVLGVGVAAVILLRLVPRALVGSWSLDIIFEAENAVGQSERLWQVVLEALDAHGFAWQHTPPAGRAKSFPRAHDPILLPSERVRLWFDNSPPGEDPNPSIVRVAFVLEPLEKGRDLAALKQTIVGALLSEENRQRAERRAVARKA